MAEECTSRSHTTDELPFIPRMERSRPVGSSALVSLEEVHAYYERQGLEEIRAKSDDQMPSVPSPSPSWSGKTIAQELPSDIKRSISRLHPKYELDDLSRELKTLEEKRRQLDLQIGFIKSQISEFDPHWKASYSVCVFQSQTGTLTRSTGSYGLHASHHCETCRKSPEPNNLHSYMKNAKPNEVKEMIENSGHRDWGKQWHAHCMEAPNGCYCESWLR